MNADLKCIGARIRRLRGERGLAQDELAARAHLHRTYLGGVERGERNLGALNLIAIARALGVPPSELLVGIPVVPESPVDSASKVKIP